MAESTLWSYLARGMRGRWDATRHEDKMTLGVPDVSYGLNKVNGWIELKSVPLWPKSKLTSVPIKLTPDQRRWISKRGRAGGNVWILVRIQRYYFLFAHDQVERLGALNEQELWKAATKVWPHSIDFNVLARYLMRGPAA